MDVLGKEKSASFAPPSSSPAITKAAAPMAASKGAGCIYVQNTQLLDDILKSAEIERRNQIGLLSPISTRLAGGARTSPSRRRASPSADPNDLVRNATASQKKNLENHIEEANRLDIEMKKAVERSIKTGRMKIEKRFNHNFEDIVTAMDLLDTIDQDLELQREAQRNKCRRQFEEWEKNVYGRIQGGIAEQLATRSGRSLNRQRNADYSKFLDITNRKAAIFRDTIIESEYDPLEPNRRSIKVVPGRLKDPTLMILHKQEEESGMLGDDAKRPTAGLGRGEGKQRSCRDTLDVSLWAAGQIEATPYGTFSKMMGSDVNKPRVNSTSVSKIQFDHFNFPRGKAAMDAEMPKGKRIVGPHFASGRASAGPEDRLDTSWLG
jgi:hypothetical protein